MRPPGFATPLQLARALALSGDMAKAKSTYDDLFMLWKSADPDIPVLKAARGGIRTTALGGGVLYRSRPERARTARAARATSIARKLEV